MDPIAGLDSNTLDMGVLFGYLASGVGIAIFVAIFIERSLSFLFEMRVFQWVDDVLDKTIGLNVDLKRWATLGVCVVICFQYPMDLLGFMLQGEATTIGKVLTTGLLAGGSGGIVKMMRTMMERSRELQEIKRALFKTGTVNRHCH